VTSDHPFSVQLKKYEKKVQKYEKKSTLHFFYSISIRTKKAGCHWSPGNPTSLQNFQWYKENYIKPFCVIVIQQTS
jgi:hypothetical protein